MSKEAAKLVKRLYKVQEGILKGEKYSRLLNSNMNMSALHEAAHAVIAVSLGKPVIDAMIELNVERNDGGTAWMGGVTHVKVDEPTTFTEKVVEGAILLASTLTRDYKFEGHIERHMGESGFDGDYRMLELFCGGDEHILIQAGAFLEWAFNQALVIHRIERVATLLSKDKVVYGSDIDRVFLEAYDNDLGGLDSTPLAPLRCQEFLPAADLFQRKERKQHVETTFTAKVVRAPIETIIGFRMASKSDIVPLRILSLDIRDEETGEKLTAVTVELAFDKLEEFGRRIVGKTEISFEDMEAFKQNRERYRQHLGEEQQKHERLKKETARD